MYHACTYRPCFLSLDFSFHIVLSSSVGCQQPITREICLLSFIGYDLLIIPYDLNTFYKDFS